MATGEVLFTDAQHVFRTFLPVVCSKGDYYGALYIGNVGEVGRFCIASASQYYNNTQLNTQPLSLSNMITWTPVRAFDFSKKRGVITTKVDQSYYPVYLNSAEIDTSVPGLSNINVFKYKDKSYSIRDDFRRLIEIDDISYIFDDKYVDLPTAVRANTNR